MKKKKAPAKKSPYKALLIMIAIAVALHLWFNSDPRGFDKRMRALGAEKMEWRFGVNEK
ncbi:MAG: hypothetical protein LBB94_03905 [Clostridiales bacterium]|nr:hypothetical protein [Clostridiales bacterium]